MPATATKSARIQGCEIFAAGTHRGKTYTTADLDAMVENFRRYSAGEGKPRLRVPCVIGHEEEQAFLERSDLPAAGWLSGLRRKGKTLTADIEDVPPEVARLLDSKAYRTVSAEIYDRPPDGIPARGKMLRRVAFLGGEIPQVKTLDEIPAVERHSERTARVALRLVRVISCSRPGTYACFSEVRKMTTRHAEDDELDRDAIVEELSQRGMSRDSLDDGVSDETLAEFLRVLEAAGHDEPDDDEDDDGYDYAEAFDQNRKGLGQWGIDSPEKLKAMMRASGTPVGEAPPKMCDRDKVRMEESALEDRRKTGLGFGRVPQESMRSFAEARRSDPLVRLVEKFAERHGASQAALGQTPADFVGSYCGASPGNRQALLDSMAAS